MNYLSKKLNKKDRGFTLVELIVVIAIIAILAAIAIPALAQYIATSKQKAIVADARTIMSAYASVVAAESPSPTVTKEEVALLCGNIQGSITSVEGGDKITFTYETTDYTITVTDGAIGIPVKKGA